MGARLSTALRLLLLSAGLGILTLPVLNMVEPLIPEPPLHGVLPDSPRPTASLSALFAETFQAGFTKWFEHHYGVRATATRLHDSISYWLFGETHPDKLVRVGTRGVLYIQLQVDIFNRFDKPDTSKMAAKVKRAQELLLAQGKIFVLMIVPTKIRAYPDDLPPRWTRSGATASTSEALITQPFVDALTAAGALFVDGRKSVASLPSDAVYARTGRHLSAPAACKVLSDALDVVRPLVHDAEVPEIDCAYRLEQGVSVEEEDFDLFRLLNIWSPAPTSLAAVMPATTERVARERRADAAVIGTSFGWRTVFEAERTHAFRHIYYYYYDSLLIDRGGAGRHVAPGSKEWKDFIASSTLLFYPSPEELLEEDNRLFLDSVIDAYGVPDGARPSGVAR